MKHGYNCFLLALFLLITAGTGRASHIFGGQLEYNCLNACTVSVTVNTYRDCAGTTIIFPTGVTISSAQPGCTSLPVDISGTPSLAFTDISPVCPGTATLCSSASASISGFELYRYTREYDICQATANCAFDLTWETCCRASLLPLQNSGNTAMWAGATLNTGITPCNSAPAFLTEVPTYHCENQTFEVALGAYDADGDSLAFVLDSCRGMGGMGLSYIAAFSPSAPFGTNFTSSFDALTGNLRLTPNPGNISVSVVCLKVEEWRNGTQIGTSNRDLIFTALPCPGNNAPEFAAYSNVSPNASALGDVFIVPPGQTLSFDLGSSDPDLGQTLSLFWDGNVPGATFADATNAAVLDSVTGASPTARFNFTPATAGTYRFTVTLQDDACPLLGIKTRQIAVVAGSLPNPPDISGQILDHLSVPLANQRVYLIKHDTAVQSLTAVDSTFTNPNGYYSFTGIQDSVLYVKAAPDSGAYPNDLPTYADTALFYSGADTFSVANVPYTVNFSTLLGTNPGGPGFIGGLIAQGANKRQGPGDPVPGLRIFLLDSATNAPLDYTDTDANGYFTFANIPTGSYKLVPDRAGISTSNVPVVTLALGNLVQDSIAFLLQSTHLEFAPEPVGVSPGPGELVWYIASPGGTAPPSLHLELPVAAPVAVTVYNIAGATVGQISTALATGRHRIPLDIAPTASGIYLLEMQIDGVPYRKKFIRH